MTVKQGCQLTVSFCLSICLVDANQLEHIQFVRSTQRDKLKFNECVSSIISLLGSTVTIDHFFLCFTSIENFQLRAVAKV